MKNVKMMAKQLNIEAVGQVLSSAYNTEDPEKVAACRHKVGTIIGEALFSNLLAPYYEAEMKSVRKAEEEAARGNLYLTLTDDMGLGQFSQHYQKALRLAEGHSGRDRTIERVSSTLRIYSPASRLDSATAELTINYIRSANGRADEFLAVNGFVTEQTDEYRYDISLDFAEDLPDNLNMPDIEERSIASPVFLVNAQNTKATFGYTVKENKLAIYLVARRFGWSKVAFHGQQVLLTADIMVR